ncbi:PREDICTED: beta-2-glycoprotein 1-like, partial [Nanorana parkeri]|uniref:beta-2-glycoprotein 1-like n=1 Tax=Nanorana parkeri TaxID=125878 RepID=UPI0008540FB3
LLDVCPTRKGNPIGQTCQKACIQDQECTKNRPKCLCDGECGTSCIKPRNSCLWPVNIENANTTLNQKTKNFGDHMTVGCHPGFKMANGQEVALSRCQGDKKWSVTAPCEEIYCPPPPEINEGILVAVKKIEYEVSEVIYYMCKKNFLMDGSHSATCLANGQWSECPACRARCKVPVQRSRVIYKGRKVWVTEIEEGLVHHGETVTFFCQNTTRACSYTASSKCYDSVLPVPDCYKEPTWVKQNIFTWKLVSEIALCQDL